MEPDDLYGLALDRFVTERGALAKAMRARKQRAEASVVAALRKPSTAAWAVNQLVRARPRELDALFEAGDALRQAQSDLLAGRIDGRALRGVADRERAAVDELLGAARGLLSTEGAELSATALERVAETLHAAALDDEARERVRGGTLVQELRHVGFGLGADEAARAPKPAARSARAAAPSAGSAAAGTRTDAERVKRERAAREEAGRARAEVRKQARTAEAVARRASERAEHAARAAEERRDRAADALDKAEAALTAARAKAAAARQDRQQARRALDGL